MTLFVIPLLFESVPAESVKCCRPPVLIRSVSVWITSGSATIPEVT
jgi:hypothetical protein